ncbi:ABC transporter permease [Rhizobiales bacterium]|uniref:ABC transporter permease n=1 Tax=Hongsoonwoonella zoysiae TaxID=2821844 RepID=UPI00156133EF|nr:ABC transporter permease [Hongsoonwoonella zoysiae]NRG17749.1 ABC transporter permease [Hongsoonwoonella zoysiae]
MGLDRMIWTGFATLTVLFMMSPLAVLVLFCFSESPLLSFPIQGWTLHWFFAAFDRPGFFTAFQNSLIVTACVGAVSTVIGTLAALSLSRMNRRAAGSLMALLTLPLMAPPLLLGIALLTFYTSWVDVPLGLHTVIASHLVFTQPFVILVVSARMLSFDFATIDSARDLGASPLQAFFQITLPIVSPSILGGALIAMALSLDDFLVTFFTIGGNNTLPTFMWGMLRRGVDPSINVVAVLIMALSLGATVLGFRITRYRG